MKPTKESKRNTAIPGHPMTETEFKDFSKVGEKGPFLSSTEYKKKFDLWVNDTQDLIVPEWHKEIVRERMKTATPESFKPWNEVRKQLKHKTK